MSGERGITENDIRALSNRVWLHDAELTGMTEDQMRDAWNVAFAKAILALAAERVKQIIGDHNMNAEREPLNPEVICKQHMAAEIRCALLGEKG